MGLYGVFIFVYIIIFYPYAMLLLRVCVCVCVCVCVKEGEGEIKLDYRDYRLYKHVKLVMRVGKLSCVDRYKQVSQYLPELCTRYWLESSTSSLVISNCCLNFTRFLKSETRHKDRTVVVVAAVFVAAVVVIAAAVVAAVVAAAAVVVVVVANVPK